MPGLTSLAGRACTPVPGTMPWCTRLLNLDCPLHVRMQRTKIGVVARGGEGERKTVVGIEGFRPELPRRDHGVRNVVAVFPGHGGADLYGELRRLEGKIVDHDRQILAASMDRRGDHRRHREAEAEVAQHCKQHHGYPS